MAKQHYVVNEIFGPTIQGEGDLVGTRCFFVRFAGCDSHCTWCDTKYAWGNNGVVMSGDNIRQKLHSLHAHMQDWVVLSGGNPILQVDDGLLGELNRYFRIAIETQGTALPKFVTHVDHMIISPKGPSADTPGPLEDCSDVVLSLLHRGKKQTLKYVVFDEADLTWIKAFDSGLSNWASRATRVIQVGTPDDLKVAEAFDKVTNLVWADRYFDDFRILPQVHVLLWGRKRGV